MHLCHITLRYVYVLLSILLLFFLQVGENKFSKLDTFVKDGVTYLVLLMGALCDEGQLESVVWFDFCDGRQFLSDLTLGDELVIGTINLVGALVNFAVEKALMEKKYLVHDVVPHLDQQFVEQSHANNGSHILKCAICHALDPMMPSLLSSNGRVCKYNEEVVLVVSSGVHTSMKGIN